MKNFLIPAFALIALAVGGCAKDPNQPQSLQQQVNMARGFEPSKEELAAAMSRFKTPGAPAAPSQPGTSPASPQPKSSPKVGG